MLNSEVVTDMIVRIGQELGENQLFNTLADPDLDTYATEVEQAVIEDHAALLSRDPAYGGDADLPLVPNAPFQSVIAYRIAHRLWNLPARAGRRLAVAVQHLARVRTGVDIHPGAAIGRRFVVDHGSGTVIGETTRIGNDCYILNGVTLGARGICANPAGKRHPTLGNRVQVGAFARILGDITIGDNVFVSPLACVTENVPHGARVRSALSHRPQVKLMPPPVASAQVLVGDFARGQL